MLWCGCSSSSSFSCSFLFLRVLRAWLVLVCSRSLSRSCWLLRLPRAQHEVAMNHDADTSRRCQWLSRGTTPPRRRCWTVEPRDATRSTKTAGEEEQQQRRTPSTSPTQAGTTNAKGRNTGTTGSITGLASATLSGHISHAVSLVLSSDDARSWGWVIRSLEGGDSCVSNIPLGSGYIGLDGGESEKKSTFVRCHLQRCRPGGERSDVVVSGAKTRQHTRAQHTHARTHAKHGGGRPH